MLPLRFETVGGCPTLTLTFSIFPSEDSSDPVPGVTSVEPSARVQPGTQVLLSLLAPPLPGLLRLWGCTGLARAVPRLGVPLAHVGNTRAQRPAPAFTAAPGAHEYFIAEISRRPLPRQRRA